MRVLEALPLESRFSGCRSAAPRSTRRATRCRPRRSRPVEQQAACCSAPSAARSGTAARSGPEQGLIGLRKALDVYANLRPARQGDIDLVIVRELVGGLYYGARGVRDDGTVFDTCEYHPSQVERIARRAFALAERRGGELVSVDKANVLDTSRLWRRVVDEVAVDHPDVRLRHALVDSFAMEIVSSPERIDVVVTENTFGDILSDVAAAVTGGLGLAASASLGDAGPGIFEPVHGSAPDIAGTGIANPSAMLRSAALLLEHGLGRLDLAAALDAAVDAVLAATPTRDAGGDATTGEFGDAVLASLEGSLPAEAGPMSPTVGFPGPLGSHSDAAAIGARPRRRGVGRPAELLGGRRGRNRGGGDAWRAADRELADRPDRRDARSALRLGALDRARGDTPDPPLLARPPWRAARDRDGAVVASRSVRPVPRPACEPAMSSASRPPRPPTLRGPSPTLATRPARDRERRGCARLRARGDRR